jgi:hypothetical protein
VVEASAAGVLELHRWKPPPGTSFPLPSTASV